MKIEHFEGANDNLEGSLIHEINDQVKFFGNRKNNTGYFCIEGTEDTIKVDIEFVYDEERQRYTLKYGKYSINTDEYGFFNSIKKLYEDEIWQINRNQIPKLRGNTGDKAMGVL